MAANVAVTFGVTSDWQSGFGGAIAIKNNGASAISGWTLEFDFNRNLDSIWNAAIVSHQGTHYVVKDVGYNSVINAGATVSFGFNGSPGNVTVPPSNYVFNGGSTGGGGPGTA